MKRRIITVLVKDRTALNQLLAEINAPFTATDLPAQINEYADRLEKLTGAIDYINDHFSELRGKFAPDTPTQVAGQLAILKANGQQTLAGMKLQAQLYTNLAARRIVKPGAGVYAGNGKCYIRFVNVGMGDCTLIATPEGARIMIDCGTSSVSDVILDPTYDRTLGDEKVVIKNSIVGKTFLNSQKNIDMLLLTHPDEDHDNYLQQVVKPNIQKISLVYFGGTEKITGYKSSAYLKEAAGDNSAVLRKVILREEPKLDSEDKVVLTKTINDVVPPTVVGKPSMLLNEYIDPVSGAIVLYHEKSAKSDFKLSILAANVTGVWQDADFITDDAKIKGAKEMKLNATEANKRSLVILVECFGKSILICGDATAVTEQFVVDYFGDQLKNVTHLRMGHHGSPTSSAKTFVKALENLKLAVASTGGRNTVLHALPKKLVLDGYSAAVSTTALAHNIFAFEADDKVSHVYFNNINAQLFATGSNDSVELSLTKP